LIDGRVGVWGGGRRWGRIWGGLAGGQTDAFQWGFLWDAFWRLAGESGGAGLRRTAGLGTARVGDAVFIGVWTDFVEIAGGAGQAVPAPRHPGTPGCPGTPAPVPAPSRHPRHQAVPAPGTPAPRHPMCKNVTSGQPAELACPAFGRRT
jgi:hypothetical protein